jgi:predicted RNA-binding protein with PIN domain
MRLLIDGYNLLHATDLFGTGKSAGTLQGSREALLAYLAAALSAGQRRATTIVFDAAGAPPGLPKTVHYDHVTVRYAREYTDADALLEDLIESHRAPRGLLVVSSDHRVQRAARRRGSSYVDSDVWYRELAASRRRSARATSERPSPGGSVDYWVSQFASVETDSLEEELRRATPRNAKAHGPRSNSKANPISEGDAANPFPPGYGEDLLEGE